MKERDHLGERRCRWEDNIELDLEEIGYEEMDWSNLAQKRAHWPTIMVMNLWVRKKQ
jgi:hypothetical protein